MSTRSSIALLLPGGRIRAIYCHCDGYPEHNGVQLARWFASPERAECLIALGDLSSINEYGSVEAYHRDAGEPWDKCQFREFPDLPSWANHAERAWAAYLYLFRAGAWHVAEIEAGQFSPLPAVPAPSPAP